MARWNKERRLLDHEHTTIWQHRLIDVDQPNLMREIFPYEEIARIDFDHKFVVPSPPKQMLITDTTFRDGQQARPPYSVRQIVEIFDMLNKLSGPRGIIRQSEFFLYSNKDKEAVQSCMERGYMYPEITGWIRAKAEDLPLVKDLGLKETGILTSVSDYHIFFKMGGNRQKIMDQYLGIVKAALDLGVIPRCHFEDVTRADTYGFCIPFALELMKLRQEYGIDVKIRLCDTLGYGVPYAGAALPRSVPRLIRAFIEDAGVPGHLLEWHGHNDFHKVFINGTTAWLYGCGAVNGALLGFGERTGNTPIEALIIEYIAFRGQNDGIDTTVITDIGRYFEKELNYQIPHNYPFVGKDFNATSAGIHADGVLKNPEIYNIFDTEKILKRPLTITITDKTGRAGVVHWLNSRLNLAGEARVDKRHPAVVKINNKINDMYEAGRITSISNEEMESLARKYLPEYFVSEFDLLKAKAEHLAAALAEELAEHEAIRSMDPIRQEPVMQATLDANPFIQFMYITNLDGQKTTRNITHITDRAKYETAHMDEDLSNRDWFINPLKSGKVFVSDFYTSRFTGALCITVSVPIRNEEDEMQGVLGLDIRFKDLAKMERDGEI
ncbi:triose-phosphate isomerase [Desulfobacca acetoxidans]|uniref:Putative cache sensor protein n=1 Tax=Desulfobacca acetoxidans (strain ATCC 700848 / DSM 11109 / ASRB2) TaxID=880072 RepID=F2NG36_DESAR|nr:histone-lysine N-methyltransferase [Desulfobacca acetoxidans]AEB08449.1 putative cache sensor protein [Desulfobacca acetoxidans DSM 11109]